MSAYAIRKATLDDFWALAALYAEAHALHATAEPGVFCMPAGANCVSREYIESLISGDEAAILVAGDGETLLGLAQVSLSRSAALPILKARCFGMVSTLVVDAAHRGQGIAMALMRAAERWAAERGATEMELNVWEFNTKARTLYAKLGYTTALRRLRRPLIAAGATS
jgi:ribosomal protein S18 acetylase RimI-like enzyme